MKRRSRYVSLAPLAADCRKRANLRSTRAGLAQLLNSLSRGPRAIKPVALDEAGTVFRIDLDELGWNGAVWEQLAAADPYGVRTSDLQLRATLDTSGTSAPVVRGDWLAFAGLRPPLYLSLIHI